VKCTGQTYTVTLRDGFGRTEQLTWSSDESGLTLFSGGTNRRTAWGSRETESALSNSGCTAQCALWLLHPQAPMRYTGRQDSCGAGRPASLLLFPLLSAVWLFTAARGVRGFSIVSISRAARRPSHRIAVMRERCAEQRERA